MSERQKTRPIKGHSKVEGSEGRRRREKRWREGERGEENEIRKEEEKKHRRDRKRKEEEKEVLREKNTRYLLRCQLLGIKFKVQTLPRISRNKVVGEGSRSLSGLKGGV